MEDNTYTYKDFLRFAAVTRDDLITVPDITVVRKWILMLVRYSYLENASKHIRMTKWGLADTKRASTCNCLGRKEDSYRTGSAEGIGRSSNRFTRCYARQNEKGSPAEKQLKSRDFLAKKGTSKQCANNVPSTIHWVQ